MRSVARPASLATRRRRITTPLDERCVPGLKLTPEHSISDALRLRLRYAEGSVNPDTLRDYRKYRKSLERFFGVTPLKQITAESLRASAAAREAGCAPFLYRAEWMEQPVPCRAGACRIKNELNFLKHLLRNAGLLN